eukprot:2435429-Pleurochrysis_carterae.AAC.2
MNSETDLANDARSPCKTYYILEQYHALTHLESTYLVAACARPCASTIWRWICAVAIHTPQQGHQCHMRRDHHPRCSDRRTKIRTWHLLRSTSPASAHCTERRSITKPIRTYHAIRITEKSLSSGLWWRCGHSLSSDGRMPNSIIIRLPMTPKAQIISTILVGARQQPTRCFHCAMTNDQSHAPAVAATC